GVQLVGVFDARATVRRDRAAGCGEARLDRAQGRARPSRLDAGRVPVLLRRLPRPRGAGAPARRGSPRDPAHPRRGDRGVRFARRAPARLADGEPAVFAAVARRLLAASRLHPWYLLWILPFAARRRDPAVLWLTFAV